MADRVLLLPGIFNGPRSMGRMENAIRSAGYRTLMVSYPSFRVTLEELVDRVERSAGDFMRQDDGSLHLVTYSLGSLVARATITRFRPARLGRVVMLAPPNQGSEIAECLDRLGVFRCARVPVGRQLTTRAQRTLGAVLGVVDYPTGVIAGDQCRNLAGRLLIRGSSDGWVSVARTKVAGMTDHTIIPTRHFGMSRTPEAIAQVLQFLEQGQFASIATSSRRSPVSHVPVSPAPLSLIGKQEGPR